VVVLVVMVVIVMMTMAMAMAMATTDKHVRNKPLCFKCGTGVRPAHWIRCDSYDSVMFCFVSFKAEHRYCGAQDFFQAMRRGWQVRDGSLWQHVPNVQWHAELSLEELPQTLHKWNRIDLREYKKRHTTT
jgi:hypothetical protein